MTYDEWLKSREGQRRNGEALDGSGRIWRRDGQETAAHKKAREEKEEDMAQSNAMSYDDYLKARGRKRTLIQPKDETSYDDVHKRSPTVMASFESRYEAAKGVNSMVEKYNAYKDTLKTYEENYEADFDGRLASSKSARAEAEEEATKLLKYINENESTIPKADREEYKRAIGEVLRAYKDIDSRLKGDKAYWNLFDNEASWGAYTDRQKSAIESQKRLIDYSRNITSAEDRMMQASSAQKEADRIRETNHRIRYQLESSNMSADMRKKWEDQIARNEEEIKNLEATANEYKLDSRVKESLAHATARDFTEDEKDLLDYRAPQENNGLEIIGRTIETGVSQLVGAGPHIVRVVSDEIGRFKAYNSSYAEGQNYDPKDLEKVDTLTWAIRKIDDRLTKEAGWANEKRETALRGHNGFTRFLSDAGVSAIVMLGDMAFANAVGAGANAMPKMLESATKGYQAIKNMAESPYLYLTFVRETGSKYDEEIARGADTTTAAINAMTTGLINAAIELGFGIEGGAGVQSLPDEVRQKLLGADKMTAKEILTDWLMDALDEGKEEIAQKFVGDFITQLTEDPRGVLNLYGSEDIPEILESGAAGVFLGGVVGGVNVAKDAFTRTETGSDLFDRITFAGTNIGSRRAERMGYTQDMLDAQIESGMQAPEGSTARAITEKIAAKRKVSVNDLRMLSKTNQQQIAEEEAEEIGKELEGEDEVTVARAKQIIRQAVLGEEISPEDTEFALSNQAVREAVNGYADVERDAFERKRLVTQEATQAASWRQEQNTDKSLETSRDYSLYRNDAFELAEAYADEETDRGETTKKTTGETIEIERIASTGKDMTIRLKSGKTVKTGDIGFSSAGEAYLYETFGRNESYTPNTATQFVRAYDGGNPAAYAAAMNYTYKVGRIGIPQGEIAGSEAAKILSPEQINMAYKLGAAARSTENASVRRKSAAGVSYDRSVDRAALNEGQKTQIRVTEEIAKVGGLAVRFYTSRVENGKRVYTDAGGKTVAAPNGYFISGTNEIMIDTEAGTNGEGKILFTLAHELTHFIKENNAKGFNALAEFLTKEYGGAGKSVSEMVSMQKAKARRAGNSISTEEAFEEFVADSMETMLADGTAAEKIAQLRKTDKRLADKIVEFFEKIKEAIKGIMAKFTPESEEGRFVKSLGDKVDELRNLFAEGVAGAAERFEAAEARTQNAEAVKKSERNSEGNLLTPEQQEFFKDSKVRDEDGNLLVVYHGTDADFNVFDRTKGRSTMDIQGSFFSPWEIDAQGYGSKVGSYYLNIKNPAPESVAYRALNRFKGQNEAGIKAREYLERLGYDGVNNSDEEYIAFHSNQIKRIDNKAPTENEDIRYSARDYSYDSLVAREDMEISPLKNVNNVDVKDIVAMAKKNAAQIGRLNENGEAIVNVNGYDFPVLIGTRGIRHGLDRRANVNKAISENIGYIIHNSILINELTPEQENATNAYVLLGVAKSKENIYIVRSVVNEYSNELMSYNVLYAATGKEIELGALNAPRLAGGNAPLSLTNSKISISQLLEISNTYFPDILSEDVLRHFGHTERPKGVIGESALYSLRNPTDAELIFNATGENVGEREQIAKFKKTSLAYENAARSEAILRVKVRQKKATQAELAEARRRTATLKDSMEEERKALSPIVSREREKMAAADAEIGERIARGMQSIRTQDQLDLLADIQRLYEGELAKADADAEAAFAKGKLAGYDEAVATIGDTLEKGQNAVEKIRAAETRTAKAEKARKDLVKLAAAWKRDIKGSRVTMPSVSDINAVARSIKQEAFSTMKTEDVRAALTEMASMIAEADTTPIKVDILFKKAKALASDLVDNAVEVIDHSREERLLLKNYLMQNKVSVEQNANDLDPAFRKRNSWWLAKTGSGIDTSYRELQEIFGETRFPDAVNPADMAENVEKAIESMAPHSENPWIGTEVQEKELMTNRIVESMVSGEIGFSYVSAKKLAGELDALKKQYAASKEAFETEAEKNAKNAATVKKLQRELEKVRDRDRKAYNEAKDEIRTQAAEIRKLKTSAKKDTRRIEAYQDRLKQKTVDKNEAVKEAKKKTKELTLTKERERVSKNELRNKIRKIAHDLQRQTENATKNKYIPAELKKAVLEAVDLIEPTSWKNLPETATMEDQMNRIHRLFADLRDNQALQLAYDASIDRKIADCATMISETTIRKLSVEQLTEIHETLSAVVKMVSDAQKLIGTTIEKDALEVSRTMRQETASIKRTQDNIGAKWIMTSISPEAVFNRFGNYVKNSYWHRMWQMLDDGQTAETQILMEAAEQFRDLMNDKKAGRLREAVDIGLKDDNGKAILISRDMMMSVYMDLINEDNARHVKGGGYIVPNIKQYYGRDEENGFGTKAMRAKGLAEELDKAGMTGDSEAYNSVKNAMNAYGNGLGMEIEKQLNDPELGSYMREWISKAQYFFDVWSKKHINATTMEYYGFEKAHVNHYFPIRTSANYRATAFESIQMDNALESMGILKDRVQSSSPILLEGLSDVIAAHARKVAQYSGLLIPTKNFEKVYGKTEYAFANSLKEQLNKKFGSSANDYISKLMGDLTGTNRRKTSMFDQLRGLQAQGVLTGSLRVTMAQAASFPTAAAEVGWGPIAKALAKGGKNNRLISRADSELIAKYSPLLWSRMKGYAELNIGDLKSGYVKKEIVTKGRWLAGWIQAVDGATVGRLWSAAEYYVQEKQPSLEVKSDDYYKEVAKVFNRIIERTQPDYDVLERPQILRGGSVKEMQGLIKQLTMFMTQRLQNNTLLIDGIENYRRINEQYQAHVNGVTIEDVQEARKKLANVITSRLVSSSLITAMKFLADAILHNMNAYRDDDENLTFESIMKQLGYSFVETEISNFLWGAEIFSVISALIGKKRYYAIEFGAVSAAASVAEEFVKAADTITSGDTDRRKKAWWRFGKDISALLGIPVSNVEKIWNAFVYHIEDIKNGDFGSFEAGVERKTSQIKDNLFTAYQYGDKETIRKWEKALAEKGNDDKAGRELVDQARKEYIKDSDPRANEAMIAYVTGDLRTYARLVDEIISDGYWTLTNVTKAIKDSDGLFATKDVAKSMQGDDMEMTMEIIRYLRAEGRDDKQIKSAITSFWKPKYIESTAKERVIIQRKLWNTGLYGTTSEEKEAFQKTINKWLD